MSERPSNRFAAAAQRFNRNPNLVGFARRTRERTLGDGLMAAFWDATSAVETAFDAADRVAPIEVDGYRPLLRTGVHIGRPRKLGGDYFGVDVAARLADAAKPGEILVSDRALEKLRPGSAEAKRRRFRAKGAPKGMAAYAVRRSGAA